MNRISWHRPIAPLWVRLILLAVIALFSFAIWRGAQPDEYGRWETGIRVFIPVCALLFYLLTIVIVNRRHVKVDVDGVRTYFAPLPGFASETIDRADVRLCFVRNVRGQYEGAEVENYWAAGVETAKGLQVLVRYPLRTTELARVEANNIAHVLNQNPSHPPVELRAPSAPPPLDWRQLKLLVIWVVLFLIALAAGLTWELTAPTH